MERYIDLSAHNKCLKELIQEYCGGMLEGHEFYGYFPGGASGGMLPERRKEAEQTPHLRRHLFLHLFIVVR